MTYNMKRFLMYALVPALALVPMLAFAQFGAVDDFVIDTGGFINNTLIPILLAVAFLVFIVGAVRFFLVAGDDNSDAKKSGKALMLWGIIAFVLIVSIWGIVSLIAGGLGLSGGANKTLENRPITPIGTI